MLLLLVACLTSITLTPFGVLTLTDMHSLHEIAQACHNGACNPVGLLRSFAEAIQTAPPESLRNSLDVKYILGHVAYLMGDGLGPSEKTVQEFVKKG